MVLLLVGVDIFQLDDADDQTPVILYTNPNIRPIFPKKEQEVIIMLR